MFPIMLGRSGGITSAGSIFCIRNNCSVGVFYRKCAKTKSGERNNLSKTLCVIGGKTVDTGNRVAEGESKEEKWANLQKSY